MITIPQTNLRLLVYQPLTAMATEDSDAAFKIQMNRLEKEAQTYKACRFLDDCGYTRAPAVDACRNEFRAMIIRNCVGIACQWTCEQSLIDLDAEYAGIINLGEIEILLRRNLIKLSVNER